MQELPCPTDEDIDAIAPLLLFVRAFFLGETSLPGNSEGMQWEHSQVDP